MKTMTKVRVFIFFILIGNIQLSKAVVNIDSLKTVLASAKDTSRMKVLLKLFFAYRDVDPNQAEKFINEGIKLAEANGDAKWNANFSNSYGQYYQRIGKVKESFRLYTKALVYAKEANDSEVEASIRSNTGALLLDCDIYDKAADYLISALRLIDKLPEKPNTISYRAACYSNLGLLNLQQKQFDEAESYFNQSLVLKTKMNDYKGIALMNNNLGKLSIDKHKPIEAEKYFKTALVYYEKAGVNTGKSMVLNNIGELFLRNSKKDSALFYFNKAYKIDSIMQSPVEMSTTLLNISNLYLEQKLYAKSLLTAKQALKFATEVGSLQDQKYAHQIMANVFDATKDFKSAYENSQKIQTLNDSIYNELTTDKITRLQVQYETEKKDQEIQLLQTENALKASNLKIQRNISWGLVGLIVFALFVIYMFFNRLKLKQAAKEAHLERNRLDIENKLLRVQMNPHFIFNSLNSIQSYISAHDTYSAELYLAKFAALMRYILQNSTQSYVTLEEELKILKLYLELEQLRFNNKFDFAVVVADNVDEEFTEIPPMLIQPFVENAIKHGIANKTEGQGYIRIDIQAEKGLLNCQVIDNGVGRGRASQLKQSIPGYKSLGMQLTGQRLELLKLQSNIDIEIDVTDLRDEKGNALGTKVVLQVPFSEID